MDYIRDAWSAGGYLNGTNQAALVINHVQTALANNQHAIQQCIWTLFVAVAAALVVSTLIKATFNVFAAFVTGLAGLAAFVAVVVVANPGLGKMFGNLS